MSWVDLALRDYPGDALLRRLLWRPLHEISEAEIWSYYTSRPRRYALEPVLKSLTHYRYACRCRGFLGACSHDGDLELRCQLASRTLGSERSSCWLRAEDALLNAEHAAVIAQYAPFPPPQREGEERRVQRANPRRAFAADRGGGARAGKSAGDGRGATSEPAVADLP